MLAISSTHTYGVVTAGRDLARSQKVSHRPLTTSHAGKRMNPKNPSGVRSVAPITIVAHVSSFGNMPFRSAPKPVARPAGFLRGLWERGPRAG